MAKVSVIVPVYCVEKYLEQCIESIIAQDYSDLEILLIDDGSTDNSGQICDRFAIEDRRVKVIHKENGGVSSARNSGIQHASGDFLMFVDGDDWLEPDAISQLVRCMYKDRLNVCFCDRYYKDENHLITLSLPFCPKQNPVASKSALCQHLQYRMPASACLALFDADSIEHCEFDTEIHTLEDWEYLFRVLSKVEKIGICDCACYHYRTVIGSASKSVLNEKKMSCFRIPDKVRNYLKENQLEDFIQYADGLEAILLNHIMVVEANSDHKASKYNRQIRDIARKSLIKTLKNKNVLGRQKIYSILIAIRPGLFVMCYRIKYKRKG